MALLFNSIPEKHFMNQIIYKLKRLLFYIKRRSLMKYIILRMIGGYVIREKNDDTVLIKTRFDKIIYELPVNNNTYLYVANPINELLLSTFINPADGTFIDVGAFIGKHTIRCAKKNTNIRVIAIEPNPVSIKILERNILLNKVQKNVEVVEAALFTDDLNTEVPIVLDYDRSKISTDKIALDSLYLTKSISFSKLISKYKVDISNNILMKIDVEGFEFDLLKSMRGFLVSASSKFSMVCEILHNSPQKAATLNFLESLNFNLEQVDNDNYFIYKSK